MITVLKKSFDAPPINEREILRYASCHKCDTETEKLLGEIVDTYRDAFSYKVCYTVLPYREKNGICDLEVFSVNSKNLAKNLLGCERVLLFGATVGTEIDRLIAKYTRISPARALLLQAFGAERIEALCDIFCREFEIENSVKLLPRFSAGYGDCPIEAQKDIFSILDSRRMIGLTLNDSMLMYPTKSVTAFVGIKEKE